jgi:SOS-response transcriptional repressor LexA
MIFHLFEIIRFNFSLDIHQQLTMLNSSTINSYISQSSIDLRNLLNESNESKSSVPLHSRCSVALEFADREQHLVEVIELPRSSHRMARMGIYKQIHKRLAVENLIDIDLTALLRTVLQSIS